MQLPGSASIATITSQPFAMEAVSGFEWVECFCAFVCACGAGPGEFFLNLLSIRGLVLASDSAGKAGRINEPMTINDCEIPLMLQDIWILVAVQRDVSLLPVANLPSNEASMLKAE